MPDLLNVQYAQTGASTKQNALGMREMQARAFEKRNSQYLLLKAPPASGKSRALMFLALDKVHHQGLEKVLIAVPEMSIGASFKDTDLRSHGFFADWHIEPRWSLCTPGSDEGKVDTVLAFLRTPGAHYLLCTHATIRFAWERLVKENPANIRLFDRALVAIDEFHHASAEDGNMLGAMLDDVMQRSTAHVVAMTGSYFRGDAVPILTPEAEAQFNQVTYTYYEQLNGYKYLKSLGLGYHFYTGRYIDAVKEVLDLSKKTIVHIPNVNSRESTGKKYDEVDSIVDAIGKVEQKDPITGVLTVRTKSGKLLKVADLVSDDAMRVNVLSYLRGIKRRDDMDIIIALGMAKEGFDWPWCEHVLTIGYRNSLTEVVQIIGRATRDCEGKTHAQFTNLIAQPDAEDKDVQTSVNSLLKAIALSLLMRDVLAPNVTFRPRSCMKPGEEPGENVVVIEDMDAPATSRVAKILENGGVQQIIESLMTKPEAIAPAVLNNDPQTTTEIELPKIITQVFPDLTASETELLKQAVKTQLVLQTPPPLPKDPDPRKGQLNINIKDKPGGGDAPGGEEENRPLRPEILKLADKLMNVDELDIDLIDQINPFQGAYEILSKSFDGPTLKAIQDRVSARDSGVSEEEAVMLWPDVEAFCKAQGKEPSPSSSEPFERRLGEVLAFVRDRKARKLRQEQEAQA
ncbi:MAG: ATP-dependent helicase [Desulfovibrio sp.]|nr:ATP-dependent helicase [Desulfovibrio sp.]